MKIAIVLGTRPEIIKMAPVIKELGNNNLDSFVLHTGQHYTYQMDAVFFEQLELHKPEYNLDIGSGSHAESTGKMLIGIEQILQNESPGIVLVEGDTNSVLAGALAATKLGIKVGHIEAGLRSYDRDMPEEINRILTDHISDFLFAPTQQAKQILLGEGISEDKIFVTGNTVVDAVYENLELAKNRTDILNILNLKSKEYFLVTLHRQENVDIRERFSSVLEGLEKVSEEFGTPVYYPIHPRAKKMMADFGLNTENVFFIDPVDYLDFLQLESNARLILTDSGGVQEESCVLRVPCVTLRDNTERPETVEAGANVLAGTKPDSIVQCVRKMLSGKNDWQNPFGDGKAAKRIVNVIMEAGYG